MNTMTDIDRTQRYDAIDALMKELLRAIRKSITTEVALERAEHFASADTLQAKRHLMEDERRALRAVQATRSDAAAMINAAANTLNNAAADLNAARERLKRFSTAIDAADTILQIIRRVLQIV